MEKQSNKVKPPGMLLRPAQNLALQICRYLQPHCQPNRINIAGSVRRKKAEVKDIEIICLPLEDKAQAGLFGEDATMRNKAFVEAVNSIGNIVQGDAATGKYVKIKPHGVDILLDLFIPKDFDYFRQYAIRTGSWEYSNKVIAAGWLKKGWCGSDKGLRKIYDCINTKAAPQEKNNWKCINPTAEIPPVWESEKHFFSWLGVEWIVPEARFFS